MDQSTIKRFAWGLYNSKNVLVDIKLSGAFPTVDSFEFVKKYPMGYREKSLYTIKNIHVYDTEGALIL